MMAKNSRAVEPATKRRYWENQIARWKESGLSQAEYCRRYHLKVHQMVYWKKALAEPNPKTSPQFVRLDLERVIDDGAAPAPTALRLVFGDTFFIEVNRGFDPATLEKLLRTLRRAGC